MLYKRENIFKRIKKNEFYDLQYNYFWKNNLWWFFKNQQIKYNDYSQNWINKKVISLIEHKWRTKINIDNFLEEIIFDFYHNNKLILISWSPGSGKSLLFTYFIDRISSIYSTKTILPVCINLVKRNWSSLIDYINKNLSEFGLSTFNSFQKIILFFDWWNEISFDKCELLKSEIEFLSNHCNNILKIIISTRTGSIKNNFSDGAFVNYILNSTYEFKIEEYIHMAYKSIENLPILNYKKNKIDDVLWQIALTNDFYDESKLLHFDSFQKIIKSELSLLNNAEVNSVIDFLFETNILYKTNYWAIVFWDQKIYEYFLSKYISNYFFNELATLRKYNFLYKSAIIENLIHNLDKSLLDKSFADKVVKNLFINRLNLYSLEDSWWGFDLSELFLKSILNLKWFELYINENKDLKRIFDTNYMNPKTVFELKKLWKLKEAKHIEYRFKENNKTRLTERRSWLKINEEQDEYTVSEKYRSLQLDQFYKDYHYELINNLKKSQRNIEYFLKKKEVDPVLMNEIVLFLIYLLKNNNIILFEKCILWVKWKKLYQELSKELTKIQNIYLYTKIPSNVFEKLKNLYSFKTLIAGLRNISYFSDTYDHIVSWILIFMLYNKSVWLLLNNTQISQIREVIYQETVFHEVWESWASTKIEVETKALFIAALLDWEKWSIYPLSKEYENTHYLPKVRSLVWLLYRFINKMDWTRNDEFIEPYLLFYSVRTKLYSCYHSINMLHKKILYWIVKYLINNNNFSWWLFKVLISKWIDTWSILFLLEKIIKETDFKDFDYSLINFLEKETLKNYPYNEQYNNFLILSYICSIKNKPTLSSLYFEKALNHTYIRYGRRNDYYFDFVIDVLSEWYRVGYINSNEVYNHCIKIWKMYNNLIQHVDWKWTRQIPALLIKLIGESCPEKISDFKEHFMDRQGWWYSLMWDFSSLLNRISKYENIETILLEIRKLSEVYIKYYKEVNLIKLVLLMRLNNVWYYAYWNSRDDIENELAELVRYFPIKSFQELQTEISHFNWSIFDQKLFISDFKKAPLPLTWNIEDLIKDNITASNDRISVIDLDFADEAIYDDILENYHKYNISSLTEQQVWLLLEKFKNQFPNYMEKIINSSLFRSEGGNMY